MNENRNKDIASFVLGIIVTTIIYLLVKREFDKIVGGGNSRSSASGGGGGSHASGGGCGCSGLAGGGNTPTNPETSPGANSLDGSLAFPNSVSSNGGMSHATFS
jgi:hypothetical protein